MAIGRLSEGAKTGTPQLERSLKRPDGETIENVTFAAAAEWLRHYTANTAQASLPEFNIPPGKAHSLVKPFAPESPDSVIKDVGAIVLPPAELRDRTRYDRVVTWNKDRMSVYAIGSNNPLGTTASIKSQPRGALWVGSDLLVWTADTITLLKGDALAQGWSAPVITLPSAEVVEGDPAVVRADDQQAVQQQAIERGIVLNGGVVILDNQMIRIRGGGGQFFINAQGGVVDPAAPRRPGDGEEILHLRQIGERVLIGTNAGRIAALELANGQLAWQTRVGETSLDQMLASDDFVAVRFNDDLGTQLVALDTFAGQVVMRFAFAAGTGPLNLALSPDGTLVYSLPDRICGKDLYEPGKTLKFGDQPLSEGNRMFEGAVGRDQLVVAEGRILAVADQGQFIRVLSLDNGKEIPRQPQLSTTPPQAPNNWNVWMRVIGPRVYVFNQRTVIAYTLDQPDQKWDGSVESRQVPTAREAFIGKRHVVLLDVPTAPGAPPSPVSVRWRVLAYSRAPLPSGGESGRLDQIKDIDYPVNIDQWQPVNGGFYYHTADGKAHFLQGNGDAAAAKS